MSTLNRRSFLGLGGAALGFAAAPRLLPALQNDLKKIRGVIWLWMDGGLPQVLTWDPKPGQPAKEIGTPIEGLQVSEWLPTCASQAAHLSIVRSVVHGAGDHDVATKLLHTGVLDSGGKDVPPLGTILAYELGKKDFPLPKFITMGPQTIPATAHFDPEFHPFLLNNADNPIPNIRRNVDSARDRERAALLMDQNKEWDATRQQDAIRKMESGIVFSEQVMNTPMLKAFNYQSEPKELRDQYGLGFGVNCLLARRLVEAGCPFVEIGLGGWARKWKPLIPILDLGMGTLICDLAQKDLLKDTLVVCATEFGRESKPRGWALDPWSRGFSIVMAGGALTGGRVVGDTGPDGRQCESPVSIKDLFATIYKACGVDPLTSYEAQGRKWKYLDGGKPVAELF
jgi:hypothetical protein